MTPIPFSIAPPVAIDFGIEWMLDPLTTTWAVSSALEAGVAGDEEAGEVVSEWEGEPKSSGEDCGVL